MVAVDSVASYLMGCDPEELVYLKLAAEAGLGTNALDKLTVYVVENGNIVPCRDVQSLRQAPAAGYLHNKSGG